MKYFWIYKFCLCFSVSLIFFWGCQSPQPLRELNREQSATIQALTEEVNRLNLELKESLVSREKLQEIQRALEQELSGEILSSDTMVILEDRGVVVTISEGNLYLLGGRNFVSPSPAVLDKLALVLNREAANQRIGVEGFVEEDNSSDATGESTSWELAAVRAAGVANYFIKNKGFDPKRVIASGYGGFRPASDYEALGNKKRKGWVKVIISARESGS